MKVRKFNENKNDPFDGEIFDEETELKNGKFKLSEIIDDEFFEPEWDEFIGFKFIDIESGYMDLEKGFVDFECIIQQNSDKKYFKFSYTKYGYNGSNILEQEAYEVKRYQKITYFYK